MNRYEGQGEGQGEGRGKERGEGWWLCCRTGGEHSLFLSVLAPPSRLPPGLPRHPGREGGGRRGGGRREREVTGGDG